MLHGELSWLYRTDAITGRVISLEFRGSTFRHEWFFSRSVQALNGANSADSIFVKIVAKDDLGGVTCVTLGREDLDIPSSE